MTFTVWMPIAKSELDAIKSYSTTAFVDRRPDTGERIYNEINDRTTN